MSRAKMESTRVFLVYVSRIYRDMISYLEGFHLTKDSWIPYRDEGGWRLRGEELK